MSMSRKDALGRVSNLRPTFTVHLLKLLVTGGQTQDYKGWCHEVSNNLVDAQDFGSIKGGKRLNSSDFFDRLFDFREDTFVKILRDKMHAYLPLKIKTMPDYRRVAELCLVDLGVLEKILLPYLTNPEEDILLREVLSADTFKYSKTFLYLSSL
jgi:hypothetical protein